MEREGLAGVVVLKGAEGKEEAGGIAGGQGTCQGGHLCVCGRKGAGGRGEGKSQSHKGKQNADACAKEMGSARICVQDK